MLVGMVEVMGHGPKLLVVDDEDLAGGVRAALALVSALR